MLFLLLFLILEAAAFDDCQTINNQQGKCVLINNCPHFFSSILSNETNKYKDLIRKSHCGFESKFFPKVCCPIEAVNYYGESGAISHSQRAPKCGLHEPNGPSDPWLALIEYEQRNGEREFLCGGVLIHKRYILTAAHCVKGPILKDSRIVSVHFNHQNGNNKSSSVVYVDSVISHENYNSEDPNQYNDIALIRLKNKISFKDDFIKPICTPVYGKKNFIGKTLYVTGYEKLEDSLKKRDGIATVWNITECDIVYNVTLRDSQICAGGKRLHFRHSHRFDYGGILTHISRDNSYTAVGILSIKPKCCDNDNNPKVFTQIASYIEWIINNLKP